MSREVEKLLAVQEADQEIRRLKREEAEAPEARRAAERSAALADEAAAAAERAVLAARNEVKRAEGEIDAKKEAVEKFRADQLKVKSNDAYRALEAQIAAALADIGGLEDAALEAMDRADEAAAKASEGRAAAAKAKEEAAARLGELVKASAARAEAMAEWEAKRAERAAGVEAGLLAKYDKIFAKWGDAAVVGVAHGACGGCHMKLSPSAVLDARKEGVVATCEYCGRILHGT
jgi:hypothetical protein